jgi:hypothetical protein
MPALGNGKVPVRGITSVPVGPIWAGKRSGAEQQPLGGSQLGRSLAEINQSTLGSVEEWS